MKPNDVVKGLTTKLIDLMKKGGKWTKPWANKRFASVDGHNYTGINCMWFCLLYTSPSPRDGLLSRMPSSA